MKECCGNCKYNKRDFSKPQGKGYSDKDGYVDTMCYAPDLYRVDEYDFYAKKGKAGWYDYDSEWGHYSRDDVIAWMPLPKPYKEAKNE